MKTNKKALWRLEIYPPAEYSDNKLNQQRNRNFYFTAIINSNSICCVFVSDNTIVYLLTIWSRIASGYVVYVIYDMPNIIECKNQVSEII